MQQKLFMAIHQNFKYSNTGNVWIWHKRKHELPNCLCLVRCLIAWRENLEHGWATSLGIRPLSYGNLIKGLHNLFPITFNKQCRQKNQFLHNARLTIGFCSIQIEKIHSIVFLFSQQRKGHIEAAKRSQWPEGHAMPNAQCLI